MLRNKVLDSFNAALAFAAFTLAALLPGTPLVVIFLVFFLALLVAQSRFAGRIHSFYELVSGACWGSAPTFFLYKLFTR